MKNQWHRSILLLLLMTLSSTLITPSHCKELRPSTHGLPNNTAQSPEMSTFFGNGTAVQPLPEARNYTDPTWSSSSSSRHVDGGDHVRKVLIVSSLVCGVAGVGLLLVAGFVFLRRFRKQQVPSS